LLLAVVAALQPTWGEDVRRIEHRGVDILVCLDVSRSMLARDFAPSRLERAQNELAALAGRAGGDRLGLVAFAGEARLVAPLTRDPVGFMELVRKADPLSVRVGGTDLGAALRVALDALPSRSRGQEVVLLLTDGEDHEGRGERMARAFQERGVKIHCIGIGTERGGKIPIESEDGETYLRDSDGREVVSALDPTSLRRIATATGGEYVDAASVALPLVALYEDRIRSLARQGYTGEERTTPGNRFQWPLLIALLLWACELSLTDRRSR